MNNAIINLADPRNEPVYGYLPGSAERKNLEGRVSETKQSGN